jgi:hypothetical protein
MRKPRISFRGTPQIRTVDFVFQDSKSYRNKVTIRFCHDEAGKHEIITIFVDDKENCEDFVIDNRDGKYKPCATHAREVFWLVARKPPKTEFAKQRLKKTKPELKVVG